MDDKIQQQFWNKEDIVRYIFHLRFCSRDVYNVFDRIVGTVMKSAKEFEEESIKAGDNDRLQVIRNPHTKIRKNNHTMFRKEDDLEVIYELIKSNGYASSITVAECLNVSP